PGSGRAGSIVDRRSPRRFVREEVMKLTSSRARERGFVLVTAVMFVLILSVLGASLLAHGPIENSLVTDRTHNTQAYYFPESGVTRGAKMMASTRMDPLTLNRPASAPLVNVPLIRAIQFHPSTGDYDSTGYVKYVGPDAQPVTLIATGQVDGV